MLSFFFLTINYISVLSGTCVRQSDNYVSIFNTEQVGTPVYRYNNTLTGAHFYTSDVNEATYINNNLPQYVFENAAYRSVDKFNDTAGIPNVISTHDVFRFYNQSTGVHLYTIDTNERDYLINNNPIYSYEGSKFAAFSASDLQVFPSQDPGTTPIFRFYEHNLGVHFYTADANEANYVDVNLNNYDNEGIAYYAYDVNII